MSIGNLKTYGNKGNNFPFQKAVLDGLSLSKLGDLTELVVSENNIVDLETNIEAAFASNSNAYLVSKSVIFDGTDYIAFLTIRTA
jgi:hypothetical protein